MELHRNIPGEVDNLIHEEVLEIFGLGDPESRPYVRYGYHTEPAKIGWRGNKVAGIRAVRGVYDDRDTWTGTRGLFLFDDEQDDERTNWIMKILDFGGNELVKDMLPSDQFFNC